MRKLISVIALVSIILPAACAMSTETVTPVAVTVTTTTTLTVATRAPVVTTTLTITEPSSTEKISSIRIASVHVDGSQITVSGETTLPDGTAFHSQLAKGSALLRWWPAAKDIIAAGGKWAITVPLGENGAPAELEKGPGYYFEIWAENNRDIYTATVFNLEGIPPITLPTGTGTGPDILVVSVAAVREPGGIMNPGGPFVEVTLKNASSEPLVSVSAFLTLSGGISHGAYTYDFGLSPENPLMPGATIRRSRILIGGGYDPAVPQALGIAGATRSGRAFTQENWVLIKSPPAPTGTGAEFSLIFQFGINPDVPNELNTLTGTFTKDMVSGPPVTTALTLTPEEADWIYRKMQEIGFFSYPETFAVTPGETVIMVTPYEKYYFQVQAGSRYKELTWDDSIRNYDGQADQLRSLIQLIKGIIFAKDAYKALPPAAGGYG